MRDTRWFDMRTDAEVNAGDIGKEKKKIELVPLEEPAEAPVQEPSPDVVPAAEPVPA